MWNGQGVRIGCSVHTPLPSTRTSNFQYFRFHFRAHVLCVCIWHFFAFVSPPRYGSRLRVYTHNCLLVYTRPPLHCSPTPIPSHHNACDPTRSVLDAHVRLISCRKAARRPLNVYKCAHVSPHVSTHATILPTIYTSLALSRRLINDIFFLLSVVVDDNPRPTMPVSTRPCLIDVDIHGLREHSEILSIQLSNEMSRKSSREFRYCLVFSSLRASVQMTLHVKRTKINGCIWVVHMTDTDGQCSSSVERVWLQYTT